VTNLKQMNGTKTDSGY